MSLSLDSAQDIALAWHRLTFPKFYEMTREQQLSLLINKLAEETGEVASSFIKKEPQIDFGIEVIDVLLVCLHLLNLTELSAESVFDLVMKKNRSSSHIKQAQERRITLASEKGEFC